MTGVIEIVRHRSPEELLEVAHSHLLADEAMNNHIFGVLGDAVRGRYTEGRNAWLSAQRADEVVGCAFRTSPWPLAISFGSTPDVAAALAADAADFYSDPFELNISPRLVPEVARGLHCALEREVGQGVYQLTAVRHPTGVAGRMRPAVEWDVDVLTRWVIAFQDEIRDGIWREPQELRQLMRRWIQMGVVAVWEVDGAPVSMASARGPTPHGIRISLVYTPVVHRQRGYASACVATLSQQHLDAGREFCFLFTDVSNPTSNHIYRSIGFEKVGELGRYRRA